MIYVTHQPDEAAALATASLVLEQGRIATQVRMPPHVDEWMTAQEIRVLQEFRRARRRDVGVAAIKAIKHPAGGGEAPAFSLVDKGFLTADAARENFTLTPKAQGFPSYDPKPEFEEAGAAAAEEPAE